MTRTLASPSESTKTIKRFLGMYSDRSGTELTKEQFTTLTNIRNVGLRALKPRLGGEKVFEQTESSGSKVYGVHTFTDDAGTDTYLKAANSRIYKSTGGAWSQIGAVTTLASATTWFATLNTKDTGSSNTVSGTTTGSTSNSIADSGSGWTVNDFVGESLTVGSEIKRIVGNDTENIYVAERFDSLPSSAAFTVNPRAQEFFFANGTDFYKCDGTTLTRLDNSTFAYAFDGIASHIGRLFAWKGTRLHWSDLGIGEHFSRNSMRDFQTPIQRVISFGSVLVVLEKRKVTAMFGDNPDNFTFIEVLSDVGTVAPKSVAIYGDYMFFLSDKNGVVVLSLTSIGNTKETNEPLSVSSDIIEDDLLAQSSANLAASCAGVNDGIYHLCVDNDWYVLDVESSFDAPRDESGNVQWIWSLDDRPDAMDANVMGHYGTLFVVGAQDNGQVYEIETGTSDDGTAISWTIEKQDWSIGEYGQLNKYMSMHVRQKQAASAYNVNYFFTPGGSTYGSAVETIDINSVTTGNHKVRVTGNPSDQKNVGSLFSFKITGSGSIAVPEIEQINMLYRPGVLR